jgi:hypothetical protein
MRTFAYGLVITVLVGGCNHDVDGFSWALTVVDAHDTCHTPPDDYPGPLNLDYKMVFDGGNATLYFEEAPFARGTIAGCALHYESVIWADDHGGKPLRWQIVGDATYEAGGDNCGLDDDLDWEGTEEFDIIASEDPDVDAGCSYSLDIEGSYAGGPE